MNYLDLKRSFSVLLPLRLSSDAQRAKGRPAAPENFDDLNLSCRRRWNTPYSKPQALLLLSFFRQGRGGGVRSNLGLFILASRIFWLRAENLQVQLTSLYTITDLNSLLFVVNHKLWKNHYLRCWVNIDQNLESKKSFSRLLKGRKVWPLVKQLLKECTWELSLSWEGIACRCCVVC